MKDVATPCDVIVTHPNSDLTKFINYSSAKESSTTRENGSLMVPNIGYVAWEAGLHYRASLNFSSIFFASTFFRERCRAIFGAAAALLTVSICEPRRMQRRNHQEPHSHLRISREGQHFSVCSRSSISNFILFS